MLIVIVTRMTITGRSICSANSYYDNTGEVFYAVLAVIMKLMTVSGRYIRSANSYCDNNRDVYVQCLQLL